MLSNSIPTKIEPLSDFSEKIISGVNQHGPALGLSQNSAATLAKELQAAQACSLTYETLKNAPRITLNPALRDSNEKALAFIRRAKDQLRVHLGHHWSKDWTEAGFPQESLATPVTLQGRAAILETLAAYFTAHPSHESKEPEVSAALASTLYTQLQNARTAVENHPDAQKAARAAQTKALTNLRSSLRVSLAELNRKLDRDSALWGAFGLAAPAAIGRRKSKKNDRVTEEVIEVTSRSSSSSTPVDKEVELAN